MSRELASTIEAASSALLVEGDAEAIGELFTHDYIVHLTDQDATGGHEAIRKVLGLHRRAFTNVKVVVEILVATKNRVAWQRTTRATHTGSFKGFPGTGHAIVW